MTYPKNALRIFDDSESIFVIQICTAFVHELVLVMFPLHSEYRQGLDCDHKL